MGELTPTIIVAAIGLYFLLLIAISFFTSKGADSKSFFTANKQSPWFVVAFGMIGASLSGVTFISIPGKVGAGGSNMDFSYMQMVFGFLVGYIIIARVLMPIYYKQNLTSIYTYLGQRFGNNAYKLGAFYFLVSRVIGAAFRLYLVAIVFNAIGEMTGVQIPFWLFVLLTIFLIWVYTFRGGLKTIVWTDTLQTAFMLIAVVFTIYSISNVLGKDLSGLVHLIKSSEYSQVFFFKGGFQDPNNFFKQFISGIFMAIVMTGLDQDMMQKNLSCRSLKDAQKNMYSFSIVLVFVNVLFLTLGALLYIYAASLGVQTPEKSDLLYPTLALKHLPMAVGLFFILGLVAAAYSSADSALTALTTSFCVDFLGFDEEKVKESEKKKTRLLVHLGFSILLFFVILAFNTLNDDAVITKLFIYSGYTYGPILGLFSFGILMKNKIGNNWKIIAVCIAAPVITYIFNIYDLFIGFKLGFLIILLNGIFTFLGLWLISEKETI